MAIGTRFGQGSCTQENLVYLEESSGPLAKRSVQTTKLSMFLPAGGDHRPLADELRRLAVFTEQAEDAFLLDELQKAPLRTADTLALALLAVQGSGPAPDTVLVRPSPSEAVSGWAADNGLGLIETNGLPPTVAAIIGAFREGATVWRQQKRNHLCTSSSHSDYFRQKLRAHRAEERLALTVYRPSAFCWVAAA